jgi:hypothetical protein
MAAASARKEATATSATRVNARASSARPAKKTPAADVHKSAAQLIDQRIAELPDWRGEMLSRLRGLIIAADAQIVEEWKWNVPVWSCHGIICTGETYKQAVKLTFAKGASLADPSRLFNASLEGNTRRAIDFVEGAKINERAFKALIKAAVSHNTAAGAGKAKGPA